MYFVTKYKITRFLPLKSRDLVTDISDTSCACGPLVANLGTGLYGIGLTYIYADIPRVTITGDLSIGSKRAGPGKLVLAVGERARALSARHAGGRVAVGAWWASFTHAVA